MLNQSFAQRFVTNSPALLAEGQTVEALGVGQVGILDAKTYTGVTSPTYAKNKALQIVWGTADTSYLPLMAGVPNENEYSKLIKGKLLKNFRGKKAKRGKSEIWTVGFSGDSADTDTLFAKPGEIKTLYVKLTGGPIDKLFSKQGITRQFSTVVRSTQPDCEDPCADVDCRLLAEDLAKQINSDPQIGKVGNRQGLVKVSTITECASPSAVDTDTDYIFELRICDTHDDVALGQVQASYPDDIVKKIGQEGSLSVYQVIKDTNVAPDAFSNEAISLIPNCEECPDGYTLVPSGFAYKIVRSDAGTAGALTTLNTNYGIAGTETSSRVSYEFGSSTYIVVSETELTAFGTPADELTFLGEAAGACVLDTPTETDWTANGTLIKYAKTFRITLADDECGEDRLEDLQAAYPDLTVSLVSASGDCVHTYETEVFSNPVEDGCSLDQLSWLKPQAFEGVDWKVVETVEDLGACKCGLKFEVAYVNRVTGECTYDYFPFEQDTIFIQISNSNPDYNAYPVEDEWVVKKIQGYEHPAGFGAHIRDLEKNSKSYALRERSFDPVVRDNERYFFQAVPDKYYDEYVLEFDFAYEVGGWSEKYVDSYHLHVYFPEGEGKAFEAAINAYVSSAALQIDPVVL